MLCAMNQPSFDKYVKTVKKGGTVLTNKTLVNAEKARDLDLEVLEIDADNLAHSIGSQKVSNIIMLAAYLATSKVIEIEAAREIVLKKLGGKEKTCWS